MKYRRDIKRIVYKRITIKNYSPKKIYFRKKIARARMIIEKRYKREKYKR